ncbi:MAG: DNA polymerase III subunit beta [Chloroflexi bacterium]|nr:DNA polymerase III subunit beta [Chloroflexota bacterium]
MKVSCLQENLAKGLAIVGRAVATRSTLPVLANILLATDQGRLKLAATNLELGITCWIGAKVEEEGATTVPARLLGEFVNSLPNDKIDLALTVRTQTLRLTCQRYAANIKGIDAEDFPLIPTVADTPTVALEPDLLREMIGQVAFAAAADDSRPVLAGVLMSFRDNSLTLAAADGFRLSVRTATIEPPAGGTTPAGLDVIVPARAMQEVARIAAEGKDPVEVTVTPNKNQVLFHLSNVDLVSRLVEGAFPNYQQIIPKEYKTRAVLSTSDFLKATKIASFFARDAANIVRLNVIPGEEELVPGRVTVGATAAEVGDNLNEIDAVVEGQPLQIAFNARYLTDVLSVLATAQVGLEASTSSSPGVVRPVGVEGFTHVIMPMHVAR